MLETLVRCSRHRWTVLKLPPRRIERRLSVAANWFAEQLTRHWVGRVDLLFTSEAMNLASLFRLMPQLARKPSVVYFHENQLPDVHTNTDSPLDLVNLNTANAATEIWFNSDWHLPDVPRPGDGADRAAPGAVQRTTRCRELKRKASVMPPPVDMSAVSQALNARVERDGTALFVETRDAEIGLLNKALAILRERQGIVPAITVGPVDGLGRRRAAADARRDRRRRPRPRPVRGRRDRQRQAGRRQRLPRRPRPGRRLPAGAAGVGVLPGVIDPGAAAVLPVRLSPRAAGRPPPGGPQPVPDQPAGRTTSAARSRRSTRRPRASRSTSGSRNWCGCGRWIETSRRPSS